MLKSAAHKTNAMNTNMNWPNYVAKTEKQCVEMKQWIKILLPPFNSSAKNVCMKIVSFLQKSFKPIDFVQPEKKFQFNADTISIQFAAIKIMNVEKFSHNFG